MANPKKQAGNESDLCNSDHTIASPHVGIESNWDRSFIALYSLEMLLSVGITFRISDAESGFGVWK